jgi:hypothetical protein
MENGRFLRCPPLRFEAFRGVSAPCFRSDSVASLQRTGNRFVYGVGGVAKPIVIAW